MENLLSDKIYDLFKSKKSQIEDWIENEHKSVNPLFFTSVDIRDSGTKVAPIDTNVFPAGFNNILDQDIKAISKLASDYLSRYNLGKKILLIPEEHTRNQFYLDNLEVLKSILQSGDLEVRVARVGELERKNNKVFCQDKFEPDVIILNNDFSIGEPEVLKGIDQKVVPDLRYGWYSRTKSHHFTKYQEVLKKFCTEFGLDPFFISAKFYSCGEVNFQDSEGIECVAGSVEKLIEDLKIEYKNHNIKDEPYAFVKADSGTYGMGIMTAKSGDDIYSMNRKLRKKMHVVKDGLINERVIIQEGIKTSIYHESHAAEPMIYMLGGTPIQYLLRVNSDKSSLENLNRSGAKFLRFHEDDEKKKISYYLVSTLACIAASQEYKYIK